MFLGKKDSELFFAVYDALTDYANGKWGVAPAVIDPNSGFVNEENQRKVAARLWRDKQVIAEFVHDNPYALSSEELAVARAWQGAFTDTFYALQDDKRNVYFMNSDAAFLITGLSREVLSVLSAIPAHVNATLLPFKDYVVYAVYLDEYPLLGGAGLKRVLDGEWKRMEAEGLLVTTGQRLSEISAELEEKRISREAERMLDSLEADMQPDMPGKGEHRSVLAGLSPDEREAQVKEHVYKYPDAKAAIADLSQYCMLEPPTRDLAGLAMKFTRDELLDVARSMRIRRVSGLKKAGIVDAIMKDLLSTESLEAGLATMDPEDFEQTKRLYDAGGLITVPASEMKDSEEFCSYIPCFCYTFLYDGTFTFAMPQQTYEACKDLDWDSVEADQRQVKLVVAVANMLVELRGALPLGDVYEQYCALSDDPLELYDAMMTLVYSPRDDLALYDVWFGDSQGEAWLVHSDIVSSFASRPSSPGELSRVHSGPVPAEVDDLFAVQKGKQPRPITEEMATIGEYVPWARTKPAVVAMRDYLDGHVPDGQNDYTFADDVVDDLIVMCTDEYPMQNISQYLSENLALSDIDQLDRVMELLTNMGNTLPKWTNNGWSPNELREGMGQGKVFYNPDGSPKRVGPYDPCPCGSGKMYKDCHGK